jgi:phosphoribosylformylglycinamidine synthase
MRIGKLIQCQLEAEDAETATQRLRQMCEQLLANPVIELYQIQVEPALHPSESIPSH